MREIVGTPQIVAQRREIMDINERFYSFTIYGFKCSQILTGSRGEGFRFEKSDVDLMVFLKDLRVIWDCNKFCNTTEHLVFDNSASQPGYGLLQLLPTQKAESEIDLFVMIKGKSYLSGAALKAAMCSGSPRFRIHGPCASLSNGIIEADVAVCILSDDWPPLASPFVGRCNKKAWPKPDLIHDIVKSGCHVVPIGSKSGDNEDVEWRISFSVAERKLVNDLTYCQFLLYGLLKLFLDEVINNCYEEDKLLCSYHIKTAVFWTLHNNHLPECCPRNLLNYFWVCLKLLLEWVDEGNCPNFFIPENNMFRNKIYGPAQQKLSQKLNKLFEDGPLCVLECPSINIYLSSILTNDMPISRTYTDPILLELLSEVEGINMPFTLLGKLANWLEPLTIIEDNIDSNVSEIGALVIRRLTINVLENIAFILLSLISGNNRSFYVVDKIACQSLKLSVKFGNVSDVLFSAMYYYRTSRFKKALSTLDLAKFLLTKPCLMDSGIDRCAEKITGQSLFEVAGRNSTSFLKLYNTVIYMNELVKEQEHSLAFPCSALRIPPYVLLLMLEFLCQRYFDEKKAQAALNKLFVVVHCDEGIYIDEDLEDISWQILGICQELSGNLRGALYAYRKSLAFDQTWNKISSASEERIHYVENLLQKNNATIVV